MGSTFSQDDMTSLVKITRDFQRCNGGRTNLYGIEASQNIPGMLFMSQLLSEIQPKRIIELGTFIGGLTAFLGMYAYSQKIELYTYDIVDQRQYPELLSFLGVQFYVKDCLSDESIREIGTCISAPGRTLVLCDGGNKNLEVMTYAPYLKYGDVIMAHDYAYDEDKFQREINNVFWNWHEASYVAVRSIAKQYGLAFHPYQNRLDYGVWMCLEKTGREQEK